MSGFLTSESAASLGLSDIQFVAINNLLAFIKFKTISELVEATDPLGGFIPIDKGNGELEKIPASVFYQILSNFAEPISPSDIAPIKKGWYKPQISSDLDKPSDPNSPVPWGEKYPNLQNLRSKSGFDTLFHYDGTIWKKTEVAIPGNAPKKVFDPTDNTNPVVMKAIAERYDKGVNDTVLNSIKSFSIDNVTLSSATIDNGTVRITGNGGYALIKEVTLNENSESSVVYKENTASNLAFGFKALNGRHHVMVRYITSGANFGKLEIIAKNPLISIKLSETSNTNYTIGDYLKLVVKRIGLKYYFQVFNITKGWTIKTEQVTTPLGVPFVAHSISSPVINTLAAGSDIYVFEYTHTSNATRIDYAIEGDSITFGEAASIESKRWASQITGNNLIIGGGADVTTSLLSLMPEVRKINPKKALIMMGGNDILFNVAPEVWKQNLRDIRNSHVAAGIQVIHCFPTPRAGAGQLIDFIKNEPLFKTDAKIDTNTPLMNGGTDVLAAVYDSGDGLHPSEAGHAKIAEIVNKAIYVSDPVYPDTFKSIDQHVEANSKSNLQHVIDESIGSNQTELVAYGKGTAYNTPANSGVWIGNRLQHLTGTLKSITFNALKTEKYQFFVATIDSNNQKLTFTSTGFDYTPSQVGIVTFNVPAGITLAANQSVFLSLNTTGKLGYTLDGSMTDCEFCETVGGSDVAYTPHAGFIPIVMNIEVPKGRIPFTVDQWTLKTWEELNGGNENLDFTTVVNLDKSKSIKYTKLTKLETFTKGSDLFIDKVCTYKLTGGNITFSSDFLALENSRGYNPAMTNVIKFFKEYGKIRYTNEVLPLEPI
ncbi:GDSL-type esterase/lipase family protein [Chryseobacterium sp.]|uniref:SGNH/GDSL hydrolase family protein n=1 Tax=Chryseobacterium sp. TaxID=1871047 RepID=UPI00321BDB14